MLINQVKAALLFLERKLLVRDVLIWNRSIAFIFWSASDRDQYTPTPPLAPPCLLPTREMASLCSSSSSGTAALCPQGHQLFTWLTHWQCKLNVHETQLPVGVWSRLTSIYIEHIIENVWSIWNKSTVRSKQRGLLCLIILFTIEGKNEHLMD